MGWFLSGALIGPAVGPFIGGIIVNFKSWRDIFYLQTAIAGVATIGTYFFLPETAHHMKYDDLAGLPLKAKARALGKMLNPWRVIKLWRYPNLLMVAFATSALVWNMYSLRMSKVSFPQRQSSSNGGHTNASSSNSYSLRPKPKIQPDISHPVWTFLPGTRSRLFCRLVHGWQICRLHHRQMGQRARRARFRRSTPSRTSLPRNNDSRLYAHLRLVYRETGRRHRPPCHHDVPPRRGSALLLPVSKHLLFGCDAQ